MGGRISIAGRVEIEAGCGTVDVTGEYGGFRRMSGEREPQNLRRARRPGNPADQAHGHEHNARQAEKSSSVMSVFPLPSLD